MSARIFISYRTTDGADKATALARDLARTFGEEAVFLDKDDLRGGSAWRQEVSRTLQERPVLLLLLTPQLIEGTAADGSLRIADPADPVRREFEAALEAGAHIIPVLCDGLAAPPDATKLPAPFHHIGELTWRKLRAYDWAHDVERLVDDLRAVGVERPTIPAPAPAPTQAPSGAARRAPWLWLVLAAAALLAAGAAWWWHGRAPALSPPAPASAGASSVPGSVAGRWVATLSHGELVVAVLTQAAGTLTLATEPIPIATRADWAEYRQFWRERTGADLTAVMYRGEGKLHADPGQAPSVDIGLKVHTLPDSGQPIDGGNLSATLSSDGQRLDGTLWLNGSQSSQPATLVREGAAASALPPATGPAALPLVRLDGPAQSSFGRFRPLTYTVLALAAEPGGTRHWRLRARIRAAAAPNSGGINFWDSSFRLLVDGVPRAPDSRLNELVDSGASKDGDLTWDVPRGTRTLVLRMHHYGETAEIPLALSGAPTTPASAPTAAGPVTLTLAAAPEAVFTQPWPATFTVLGVASEARRSGVFGVRVRMRMTLPANQPAANFGDDQFRLLVDGVPRAPDSRLNLVVDTASALDGDVSFEVPDTARALTLRIQHANDMTADLPLQMERRP